MLTVQRPPALFLRLTHDISPDYFSDDNVDFSSDFQTPPYSPAIFSNQSALTIRTTTAAVQKGLTNQSKDVNNRFLHLDLEDNNNDIVNQEVVGRRPDIIETHICRPNNKFVNSQTNYYNVKNEQLVDRENSNLSQEIIDTNSQPSSPPPIRTRLGLNGFRNVRRPRKLPEIPRKYIKGSSPEENLSQGEVCNEKSLAEEFEEAVRSGAVNDQEGGARGDMVEDETINIEDDNDDVFWTNLMQQASEHIPPLHRPIPRQRTRRKCHRSRHISGNNRGSAGSDSESATAKCKPSTKDCNLYDSDHTSSPRERSCVQSSGSSGNKDNGGDDAKKLSSCLTVHAVYLDLEVTHRGMHRFVPRHDDEVEVEIGDPIHVTNEADDLWCEGVNLRSGKTGIFPSMYATNLDFMEEEDEDEEGTNKFTLRFMGSVEVRQHKGDDVLRQAISKVVSSRREAMKTNCPPMCTLEISDYGILMLDKSKEGHQSDNLFTHFFSLKNISFCGHHPKNERYFAFITKHPNAYKYACHVFLGERSTLCVSDAVGQAFKRFYQEYMAFTHPTEDIYME